VAHGDAREEKWSGKRRMEWVASSLQLDSHSKKASTRLNWQPRRYKWTRPFRWKIESGFCACAITFRFHSTYNYPLHMNIPLYPELLSFCKDERTQVYSRRCTPPLPPPTRPKVCRNERTIPPRHHFQEKQYICMLIKSLSSYCRQNFDPNLINQYHHIDPWPLTAKFWLRPLRLGLINVTSYLHFPNKTNTCYRWHRHKYAVICNVIWLPIQILLDMYWI